MSKKQITCTPSTYQPLSNQTGEISVPLTNDILFKLLMQRNKEVLKEFLAALLHLNPDDITSVQITNTYIPGQVIDDKQIILDINLILNNSQIINLEMQVLNKGDWKERSIFYLCHNFNSPSQGDTYITLMPTHHIGVLDFTLPDLNDAFYYHFYLMDDKSHKIYSDKLILSVLNLNKTELATDEEIASGLQYWAQLFKSTTWEELKMLAKQDTIFESAANTINEMLQEHRIRYECERRQMDLNADRQREAYVVELQNDVAEKQAEIIRVNAEHAAEIIRVNTEHETEMARVNSEHEAEMARVNAEYAAEISRLREELLKAQQKNK